MSDGIFIPQNVRFMAQKLSGYSRNRFKIMPLGARTASAGTNSNFALPENCLLDTASIRLHANVVTTGGSAGAGPTVVYGKLPQDAVSLVQRLNVSLNGISIMNSGVSEYNSLCKLLKNAGGSSRDRDSTYDRAVSHGGIDGTTDANEDVSVVIQFPAGALSENSTRFWPTMALGSLTIECQWADNSVLVPKMATQNVGAGDLTADGITAAAAISYTVSDLYMTVDTISLPTYDEMLRQRLASEAYLGIFVKSYYTFSKDGIAAGANTADTMVFSLSSSSIDRIIGTHRNGSYRTTGVRGWALTDQLGDAYVGNYFRFLSLDSSTTKAGSLAHQFQLNNTPMPTYKANVMESLADLAYSVDKVSQKDSGMICSSIPAFHEGLYACPLLLAHPTGQVLPAGFDSRGVASQGQWEVTGATVPAAVPGAQQVGTVSSFIAVECTEEIRFSLGREVIHVH